MMCKRWSDLRQNDIGHEGRGLGDGAFGDRGGSRCDAGGRQFRVLHRLHDIRIGLPVMRQLVWDAVNQISRA